MTKQQFLELYQQAMHLTKHLKKQSNLLSMIRFGLSIMVIVDLLIGYFQNKPFLYILALLSLMIFMIIVVYHQHIQDKLRVSKAREDILNDHIQRIDNKWDVFEDGKEFIKDDDYRSYDLDIFGKHSLYQMINICFTQLGRARLAMYFTCQKGHNQIKERQEAVKELSQHIDFVFHIQTYGKLISKQNEKFIHQFIQLPKQEKTISLYFMLCPIMTCIALLFAMFSLFDPYSYIIGEVGIVIQLGYAFIRMMHHNSIFEPIAKLHKSLKGYYRIFELIENENFESEYLKTLQKKLIKPKHSTLGIAHLSKISQSVTYRQNIFAFVLLNALFSFDHIQLYRYQRWLLEYGQYLESWIDTLAEIEACMSLSVTSIDQFDVCIPTIKEDISLSFQNMRHPLIHTKKVVGNSWSLTGYTNIITGSNMSGKTTFMRTIALNLILAYAGGFVFADEMTCSFMNIYTSMRVKDNVEEGISTFYGELLRIKEMIDQSQDDQPMICFIDEIFKGTNSLDRFAGAKATIEALSLPHCLLFMTTHDFELCQMSNSSIQNYHFDEYYENGKIYFDYHIKNGQSKSTNGQFLLKQLGILKE